LLNTTYLELHPKRHAYSIQKFGEKIRFVSCLAGGNVALPEGAFWLLVTWLPENGGFWNDADIHATTWGKLAQQKQVPVPG